MQPDGIKTIGIAGAGLMGSGTATISALNGFNVIMMGTSREDCERGLASVNADIDELVENNLVTKAQAESAVRRLTVKVGFEHGRNADFIFEAVLERVDVKGDVYRELEKVCAPGVVFASITSGLSPDDLAATVKDKSRLLVAHFWNPAHLVPLVEVVRSEHTSDQAVHVTAQLLKSLNKEVVLMDKNVPGFIGNRLMHSMYREAVYLVESGYCTPEDIDRSIYYSFGQRFGSVGLLEYYDSVGLDLQRNVQSYLFADLCNARKPQKYLLERCKRGDLGPKTGQGIYDWTKKDMADFRHRKNSPFFKMFRFSPVGEDA